MPPDNINIQGGKKLVDGEDVLRMILQTIYKEKGKGELIGRMFWEFYFKQYTWLKEIGSDDDTNGVGHMPQFAGWLQLMADY